MSRNRFERLLGWLAVAWFLLLLGLVLASCVTEPDYPVSRWTEVCIVDFTTGVRCVQRQCDVYADGHYDCLNKPERPCTPRRCPVII